MEGGVLDVVRAAAVMVDEHDLLHPIEEGRTVCDHGPLGIHHHQDRVGLHHLQGLRAGDEELFAEPQPVHLREGVRRGVVPLREHDEGPHAGVEHAGGDAQSRAQAVHVRVLVAHDEHVPAALDELAEGLGEEPHLDPALLGVLLLAAAVESVVGPVPDHGLVAATAESQLHGGAGSLLGLGDPGRHAHGHGQRQGGAGARLQVPGLLQQLELLLLDLGDLRSFQHAEEAAVLVPAVDASGPAAELGDQALHLGQNRRAVELPISRQLLVVVHVHQHHVGHLLRIQPLVVGGFGPIQPVLEQELFAGVAPADRHGHDLVVGAGEQDLLDRGLGGLEVGEHVQHVLSVEHGGQGVVAPDDLAVQIHQQHRDVHLADELRGGGVVVGEDGVHELLLLSGHAYQQQEHDQRDEARRAQAQVSQHPVVVPDRAGQGQQGDRQEDQDPSISFHRCSFPARRLRMTPTRPSSSSTIWKI